MSADTPVDPFAPAKLGPVTLRNRFIKAATFEGRTPKGVITRDLIDFHTEYARGGMGMTTVAYLATSPEGRTDRHAYHWGMDDEGQLRVLTDAVHAEGAAVSAQIGHAGAVANSKSNKLPGLAPGRFFAPASQGFTRACTHEDIARITREHAEAARGAINAGFDAIEIHFGHNYLVSEFLSPKYNKRTDSYGGSLENRARFAREIGRAVRDEVGDEIGILIKLNMDDGISGGFWIDEAVEVSKWLEADGSADALEMTAGSSLANPLYLFKGGVPLEEFAASQPPVVQAGMKVVGKSMFKEYPYNDLYLLDDARQIRDAVDLPMVLLGGIMDLDGVDRGLELGFQFVAMGRAALREPDLVNKLRDNRRERSLCNHSNKCMATIYRGTECVLRRSPA